MIAFGIGTVSYFMVVIILMWMVTLSSLVPCDAKIGHSHCFAPVQSTMKNYGPQIPAICTVMLLGGLVFIFKHTKSVIDKFQFDGVLNDTSEMKGKDFIKSMQAEDVFAKQKNKLATGGR